MASLIYVLDISGDTLAEKGLTWLHTMPIGKKEHPVYGMLDFTKKRLQRFADNVKNRVRKIDLDVDYAHKKDLAKGEKAAGWIRDAEVRDDGLWIGVEFTDTAKKEIKAGEWKYLSPEFYDEWTDADGNSFKDVLFGAALTNRPFLKDLLPVAASETYVESFKPEAPPPPSNFEFAARALAAKQLSESVVIELQDGMANWSDRNFVRESIYQCNRYMELAVGELLSGSLASVKSMAREVIDAQVAQISKLVAMAKTFEKSGGEEYTG
jgi:hypothetical protein